MVKRRIALIVLLILGLAAPAFAADDPEVTQADLDAARRRNAEISASIEAADARYQAAIAEEIQIRERLLSLATTVSETEQRLAALRLDAQSVVQEQYMTAGSDGAVSTILGAHAFSDIPVREVYLATASDHDLEVVAEWVAVEEQHRVNVAELEAALARQRDLVAEIEGLADELIAEMQAASDEYRELQQTWQRQEDERKRREEEERLRREEEARRQAAAAAAAAAAATTTTTISPPAAATATTTTTTTTVPSSTTTAPADTPTTTAPAETTTTTAPTRSTSGLVCPVDGPSSFSDTWGAPRSGGRTHKGVDMSAPRGTPLVAIETGRIYRLSNSTLGGISVYLLGNSGDMYYYAHLDAWADGLAGGQKVTAGDLVGSVGTTGNSPSWLPHLHFGWQPGGGDWANPYPLVADLCR